VANIWAQLLRSAHLIHFYCLFAGYLMMAGASLGPNFYYTNFCPYFFYKNVINTVNFVNILTIAKMNK
jgi:hypothetical protein